MTSDIKLSDNALKVLESRYLMVGEDWEKCCLRVANVVSSVESNKQEWKDKFFDVIHNMLFLPGGRILRNAGRPQGTMFNCFVLPIGDSIEEIGQFMKDSLVVWANGGGVGVSFSSLRPTQAPILGKGGYSSGLVSFLTAADGIASTIESGGQRRSAGLCSVSISHPEVLNFKFWGLYTV